MTHTTQLAYWSLTSRAAPARPPRTGRGGAVEGLTAPASPPSTAHHCQLDVQFGRPPGCRLAELLIDAVDGRRVDRDRPPGTATGKIRSAGRRADVPGWGRRSSSRSSRGAGGRPVALGEVHLFLSVRRRQASRVRGVTIRCSHRRSGNSSAKAAITGRPAHRGFGQAS